MAPLLRSVYRGCVAMSRFGPSPPKWMCGWRRGAAQAWQDGSAVQL